MRDLDDCLEHAFHDVHKLGQSNKDAIYFHGMQSITESMNRNTFKFRTGQVWNSQLARQRQQPYRPGEGICQDARCPLCHGEDSGGHVLGGCMHKDMTSQFIARHDKAMRSVIQSFTKGRHGSFYLVADVGKAEGLKEIGIHSKRVPAFVLPDACLQANGLDPAEGRDLLQRKESDTRSKMRPDMMIVEMTAREQNQYVPHGATAAAGMPKISAHTPNGKERRIWIVEAGYCSDTRYEEKLQEKEDQHIALQTALKNYRYSVITLPVILGVSGSIFHTTKHALAVRYRAWAC